jgi:hypothetical protein
MGFLRGLVVCGNAALGLQPEPAVSRESHLLVAPGSLLVVAGDIGLIDLESPVDNGNLVSQALIVNPGASARDLVGADPSETGDDGGTGCSVADAHITGAGNVSLLGLLQRQGYAGVEASANCQTTWDLSPWPAAVNW